jgi:hypothetical protein
LDVPELCHPLSALTTLRLEAGAHA